MLAGEQLRTRGADAQRWAPARTEDAFASGKAGAGVRIRLIVAVPHNVLVFGDGILTQTSVTSSLVSKTLVCETTASPGRTGS